MDKKDDSLKVKVKKGSKYADLINKVAGLTVTELNDFVKELQDHFQISSMAAPKDEQDVQSKEKSKDEGMVDLVLLEVGQSKIAVIKVISKITGKGLLEAKKMLNTLPLTVLSKKPEAEAQKVKEELQNAGAAVELK